MLVGRKVLESIGLLDEVYFMILRGRRLLPSSAGCWFRGVGPAVRPGLSQGNRRQWSPPPPEGGAFRAKPESSSTPDCTASARRSFPGLRRRLAAAIGGLESGRGRSWSGPGNDRSNPERPPGCPVGEGLTDSGGELAARRWRRCNCVSPPARTSRRRARRQRFPPASPGARAARADWPRPRPAR